MSMKLSGNMLIAIIGVLALIVLAGGVVLLSNGSKPGVVSPSPAPPAPTATAMPTSRSVETPLPVVNPTMTPKSTPEPTPYVDVNGQYSGIPTPYPTESAGKSIAGGTIKIIYYGLYRDDVLPCVKISGPNDQVFYDGPVDVTVGSYHGPACTVISGFYGTYKAEVYGSTNETIGGNLTNIAYSGGGSVVLSENANAGVLGVEIIETDTNLNTS